MTNTELAVINVVLWHQEKKHGLAQHRDVPFHVESALLCMYVCMQSSSYDVWQHLSTPNILPQLKVRLLSIVFSIFLFSFFQ
jgi:hypothetical protein